MTTRRGTPADWLTPGTQLSRGRWTKESQQHQRVEVTEQDLGIRVRCHDCGAIARENYHRPVFDAYGDLAVPEYNPIPWALSRLDRTPCEPLGVDQPPLFQMTLA